MFICSAKCHEILEIDGPWLLNILIALFSTKCVENVANFTEIDCRDNGLVIFKIVMLCIVTAVIGKKKSNSTEGYGYVIDR